MCKKCVVGVIIDLDTDEIIKIFKDEPVECDIEFKFCPECGEKL